MNVKTNLKKLYCVGPFQYGSYNQFPASTDKFRYVIDSIINVGISVELASIFLMDTDEHKKQKVSDLFDVRYLVHTRSKNRIVRILLGRLYYIKLFLYLIRQLNKNSTLLAYHCNSVEFMAVLRLARFFKRFKLILEVEEIYADVVNNNSLRKKEIQFFQIADAFIFPTFHLNSAVNLKRKPFVIAHGNYKNNKIIGEKFSRKDGKIHLIYAGTLSRIKGGAFFSARVAKYLSEEYHMHILGFGSPEELKEIKRIVEEVSESTKCSLSFEGAFSGDEFLRFLQGCDIGLSTQTPSAIYNDTSFPSKVLTYLVNGLSVVSVRIPVLEESAVNDLIWYYDLNDPQEAAKVIQNVDKCDSLHVQTRLNELDARFKRELVGILDSTLVQNQTN